MSNRSTFVQRATFNCIKSIKNAILSRKPASKYQNNFLTNEIDVWRFADIILIQNFFKTIHPSGAGLCRVWKIYRYIHFNKKKWTDLQVPVRHRHDREATGTDTHTQFATEATGPLWLPVTNTAPVTEAVLITGAGHRSLSQNTTLQRPWHCTVYRQNL